MESNTWKEEITEVTVTKNIVGRSNGNVIDQRVRTRPAPSRVAASYTEVGICCSPARKNNEMYPTVDHTCTNSTDGRPSCGSLSHSTRRPKIGRASCRERAAAHGES